MHSEKKIDTPKQAKGVAINTVILEETDRVGETIFEIKDSARLTHLNNVLKIQEGESLHTTYLNHGAGKAKIIKIEPARVTLELSNIEPTPPNWTNLFIGLSRPQTIKKILEYGTTFGVKNFHFFKAELSEKSYLQSNILNETQLLDQMRKGLAQARNYSQLPTVKIDKYCSLKLYSEKKQKFILCLESHKGFKDVDIDFDQEITLAIGPERGWSEKEKQGLRKEGFIPIKVSSSALRVEVATLSAISQLEMLRGFSKS